MDAIASDVGFGDAFHALMGGGDVTRGEWIAASKWRCIRCRKGSLIPAIDAESFGGRLSFWVPQQDDIFATDWIILG
jgi:hypothetical protein